MTKKTPSLRKNLAKNERSVIWISYKAPVHQGLLTVDLVHEEPGSPQAHLAYFLLWGISYMLRNTNRTIVNWCPPAGRYLKFIKELEQLERTQAHQNRRRPTAVGHGAHHLHWDQHLCSRVKIRVIWDQHLCWKVKIRVLWDNTLLMYSSLLSWAEVIVKKANKEAIFKTKSTRPMYDIICIFLYDII